MLQDVAGGLEHGNRGVGLCALDEDVVRIEGADGEDADAVRREWREAGREDPDLVEREWTVQLQHLPAALGPDTRRCRPLVTNDRALSSVRVTETKPAASRTDAGSGESGPSRTIA